MALGHVQLTPSLPTPTTSPGDCWGTSLKTVPATKGLVLFSCDRNFQVFLRKFLGPTGGWVVFPLIFIVLDHTSFIKSLQLCYVFSCLFCTLWSWSLEMLQWLVSERCQLIRKQSVGSFYARGQETMNPSLVLGRKRRCNTDFTEFWMKAVWPFGSCHEIIIWKGWVLFTLSPGMTMCGRRIQAVMGEGDLCFVVTSYVT